jgi:hypothetical protein
VSDVTAPVVSKVKGFWAKIAEFFKNTAGQFSSEELLKILAGFAAIALAAIFFFSNVIPADKASYVFPVVGSLLAYALGQGIAHNATGQ